jgi:hypothetical protein
MNNEQGTYPTAYFLIISGAILEHFNSKQTFCKYTRKNVRSAVDVAEARE